jgi:hypothetical protein
MEHIIGNHFIYGSDSRDNSVLALPAFYKVCNKFLQAYAASCNNYPPVTKMIQAIEKKAISKNICTNYYEDKLPWQWFPICCKNISTCQRTEYTGCGLIAQTTNNNKCKTFITITWVLAKVMWKLSQITKVWLK